MPKFLDLTWWLGLGSFSSTVCLSALSLTGVVVSRRRSNREKTRTGISPSPVIYTACPKAFDFAWSCHLLVVVIFATVFFIIGSVFSSNGPADSDPIGTPSRGNLFWNVAVALQLHRSLSEVSQRRRVIRILVADGSSRHTGFVFGRNHGCGRCGCMLL